MKKWKNIKCNICNNTSKHAIWIGSCTTLNHEKYSLKGYVKCNKDDTFHLDKLLQKIEKDNNIEIDDFNGDALCIKCGSML